MALRRLKLACVSESVPVIPKQTIPELNVGAYLDYRLKVKGGNGDIAWRILSTHEKSDTAKNGWRSIEVKGQVLPGLTLSLNGVVSGAPAKTGVYKSAFSATDGDPNEPDTAELEMLIIVGPRRRESVLQTLPPTPKDRRLTAVGRRKEHSVYGFDLGVNDNDGTGEIARIMWKGTAENETDTSSFGALVLREGN